MVANLRPVAEYCSSIDFENSANDSIRDVDQIPQEIIDDAELNSE